MNKMSISTHLSINTLNVLDEIFQSKGISGSMYKNNKMQLCAFYKRLTSEGQTHRLKVKKEPKIHAYRKETWCSRTNLR